MLSRRSSLEDVLSAISKANRLLVTAHARPDGDAIGSVLACWMMLQQLGKQAEMVLSDRVPKLYRWLPCSSHIRHSDRVDGNYDAVIILECDSIDRTRLTGLDGCLLINIDHHTSGREFADLNLIDTGACAVAEMVYRLAGATNIRITPEFATCLYCAVLTDTGSFCYERTDGRTFELAAELVGRGANPVLSAQSVYFSNPLSKMLLLGAALSNLHCDGRLCWLWVTQDDLRRAGAAEEDCEGIVNYGIGIAGVEVAVFLRELPDQRVRLSLRSKGQIDVASIAERFGGGGHENASGCTLKGSLAAAMQRILSELRNEMVPV